MMKWKGSKLEIEQEDDKSLLMLKGETEEHENKLRLNLTF